MRLEGKGVTFLLLGKDWKTLTKRKFGTVGTVF